MPQTQPNTIHHLPFAIRLIEWQKRCGRHDLPWQNTRDPYRIWLSEVMLQQTQVVTVIPYYRRFLSRFPSIRALAEAREDDVLAHWSGLGYYARASNLQRAAQRIMRDFGGKFPRDAAAIESLPGIGRSTAAAIAVFAFGQRRAILDGNVKRVLSRHRGISVRADKSDKTLWDISGTLLPHEDIEAYTQALMDLGATVCTRRAPKCGTCPLRRDCVACNAERIDELPRVRSKRVLPEKAVAWLVLLSREGVLLQKRPPTGVWANLWCFPEASDAEAFARARQYGVPSSCDSALQPFRHTFSHFRLSVTPLVFRIENAKNRAAEPGEGWFDLNAALAAAVPAPVRRVLTTLSRG